ncbi:MAG: MFS transporter [Candidatus Diapherotrites archaeon]|nr:MFS transporter [Candidatus Diapherotrites archaeon]
MNKEEKKTVRTFALASFLNDLGSDIIYPIWPIFVTSVLGANMAILGFIDGLGEALVSISQAISGYASDKLRRRKVFIWTGYVFGAVSRVGYAFSTAWHHLVPFRILDRAGKIRGAPRDAMIADVSSNENRGRNFGLLRTMDNLGAVLGIIVCLVFFPILGYKNLFILASIPSFLAALLVIFIIKETKAETRIYKGFRIKDLSNNFKLFLFLSAIFAFGSFSYSFLLVFSKSVGFEIFFVPVLYLLFTFIASVFSLPAGKLSDRIGRKPLIMVSYVFWAVVCFIFIYFKSIEAILIAFIFYGLHKGALEPVQKTFVSELAPQQHRASALGTFQMVVGLCALPASAFAGLLWDSFGIEAPFCISLALTFISFVLLFFVRQEKR